MANLGISGVAWIQRRRTSLPFAQGHKTNLCSYLSPSHLPAQWCWGGSSPLYATLETACLSWDGLQCVIGCCEGQIFLLKAVHSPPCFSFSFGLVGKSGHPTSLINSFNQENLQLHSNLWLDPLKNESPALRRPCFNPKDWGCSIPWLISISLTSSCLPLPF